MSRLSSISRNAAALLAGLTLATAACAAPAAALETLRVGKSAMAIFSYTLLEVGMRSGIFAKHGLEIESTGFGSGPRLHQAMAADSIDIGLDTGPDLALVAKGAPVKAVASLAGRPVELVLVVKADSPIKSVDDIRGRKVAVTATTSLTGWFTRELARLKGWGPDGIRLVSGITPQASWPLLKTGEVDGITTDLASVLQAQERGEARLLFNYGDLVSDFHIQVIFATDRLIATRPGALRAFLAGWLETIAFARADKPGTVAIERDILGFDAKVVAQLYDRLMPVYSGDGRFDPKALKVLSRSFVDMGTLTEEPDVSRLFTEEFLPKK